jgi:hypothetical protein
VMSRCLTGRVKLLHDAFLFVAFSLSMTSCLCACQSPLNRNKTGTMLGFCYEAAWNLALDLLGLRLWVRLRDRKVQIWQRDCLLLELKADLDTLYWTRCGLEVYFTRWTLLCPCLNSAIDLSLQLHQLRRFLRGSRCSLTPIPEEIDSIDSN